MSSCGDDCRSWSSVQPDDRRVLRGLPVEADSTFTSVRLSLPRDAISKAPTGILLRVRARRAVVRVATTAHAPRRAPVDASHALIPPTTRPAILTESSRLAEALRNVSNALPVSPPTQPRLGHADDLSASVRDGGAARRASERSRAALDSCHRCGAIGPRRDLLDYLPLLCGPIRLHMKTARRRVRPPGDPVGSLPDPPVHVSKRETALIRGDRARLAG